MPGIELATAYVSIVPETSKLEAGVKAALTGVGKTADDVGTDVGKRMADKASKALKDGWRPDQDIMAGIPDTKLDRIGARMGQLIGKGVVAGLKGRQLGQEFGSSFAAGAGSVGLGSIVSGWRRDLKDQPNKLGYLAGKGVSAGLQAGMAGATAIIATALKTGFDRLVALDTAQNKLRAVLRTSGNPADFDRINKAVQKAVDKTPFSLDQAFSTAVQAIGAGSQDIERFMKNVADAAGFAGTDIERMGLIFNQVLAKNKLTGEETMQLMEAGLPARSWIQDSYDLTNDQFEDMAKNGQISLDMLQKAIEDHAPGMAQALGNTLQGSIDNMQTALARVGANFLSAVFGGPTGDAAESMKGAVQRITGALQNLDAWVIAHKDDIKNFFDNAKDAITGLVNIIGRVGDIIREHPQLIKTVTGAFLVWNGLKFTGLLNALGSKGGGGVLGKLALVVAAVELIDRTLNRISQDPTISTPVNERPDLLGQAGIIAGGAYLGGRIAGPPGALIGGAGAALIGPTMDMLNPPGPARNGVIGPGVAGIPTAPNSNDQATVGGIPIPGLVMPGTAGRGYFNSRAAAAYLDSVTAGSRMTDDQLLSRIPAGRYDGGAVNDLTRGLADCSSSIEDLVNIIDGRPTAGREMTTFNAADWLTSRGFRPGTAPGAFNVGFTNQGTPHMEATLPGGTNFNWGNNADAARGGRTNSAGAFSPNLTQRFHRFGEGGSVTGSGSASSDSIPAMLSNGEHVLSASDVNRMGGQGAVYGFRSKLQGFARGGAVIKDMRTAGAIPAAAGAVVEAGSSTISQFIDMGGEVVTNVIDQVGQVAADAASVAATAAVATSTSGGAAPVAPLAGMAASQAVQMGTEAAKRGIQWGSDMLGIGADALLQQLTPFGMPRWLTADYSGFVPQQAITGALGNLMSSGAQQSMTADANLLQHGTAAGAPPGPGMGAQTPPGTTPPGMVNALAQPNIDALGGSTMTPAGQQPMFSNSASSFLSTELQTPEAPAPDQQPMFKVDQIITTDAESVGRELTKRGRLAQMQYANRPGI